MSRRPLAPTPWPLSESGAAKARFNSLARTAMNERQAGKKLDSKPPKTVCLFIWGSTRPGTGLRLLEVSLHDLWDRPKIIFGRYVPQRKKKLPFGLKRPQRLFPVTIFMMNYLYLILKKVGSFFFCWRKITRTRRKEIRLKCKRMKVYLLLVFYLEKRRDSCSHLVPLTCHPSSLDDCCPGIRVSSICCCVQWM